MTLWCVGHERYENVPGDKVLYAELVKSAYVYDCNEASDCKHYERDLREIDLIPHNHTTVLQCTKCGRIIGSEIRPDVECPKCSGRTAVSMGSRAGRVWVCVHDGAIMEPLI